LAAAGSAAGQAAPDYKAMVCIFLFGGNDAHNMVLATDTDSWTRYFAARNTGSDPIALMPVGTAPTPVGQTSPVTGRVSTLKVPEAWGGVLPIVPNTPNPVPPGTNATTRTFGLHPYLAPVQTLFNAGRLAVVANVGTLVGPITKAQYVAKSVAYPANLYSHNDQQSTWQAGASEGARVGWGGRFSDLVASANGSNSLFTAISTSGNAVFLSGNSVTQYQITTAAQPAPLVSGATATTLFGSSAAPAQLSAIIQDVSGPNLFSADYSTVVGRSMASAATLNTSYTQAAVTAIPAPTAYTNAITGIVEPNSLASQLQTVAKMIAANATLGLKRQVFFVSLGGWDTHDFQNTTQPNLLGKVAHAMSYFDGVLASIGGVNMRNNVTTFTASDFSRTFTTNGDGTDHAWGSHHFVMGGAVNGKNIYGQYPTLGVDLGAFKNPDMAGTALVPTTSVDQYGATIGKWFGVSDTDLATIFPNLQYYSPKYLTFV
jgi:uncharacterized protein (DUF1501 family)